MGQQKPADSSRVSFVMISLVGLQKHAVASMASFALLQDHIFASLPSSVPGAALSLSLQLRKHAAASLASSEESLIACFV